MPVTKSDVLRSLAAVASCAMQVTTPAEAAQPGLDKINHAVIIMQENHSFDNYFGTYPGANGIPAGVCQPDLVAGAPLV